MAPTKQLRRTQGPKWTNHSVATRRRTGPAPKPWVADVLAALAGIGFGIVVALVVIGETGGTLASPGGWLIAIGRLAGFTGTYLMLVMIVLIARLPWLERTVGQDRLVRWHRKIGPWPVVLIAVHVVTIVLGYAQMTKVGPLHQLWIFLSNYPDMLAAMVGFVLIVMAGLSSAKIARRKMKYETWWIVHLYIYLALALAFAHQIVTGVVFLGHPLTRAYWIAIWSLTAGVVLVNRFLLPIVKNLRYQLRIADIVEETPGRLLADDLGQAPFAAGRVGRPVLPVAIRREGPLLAQPPLLALSHAASAVPARHGKGTRRPVQGGCSLEAGNAGLHRRPLRHVHTPRAHARPGRLDRRWRRYHPTSSPAGGSPQGRPRIGRDPSVEPGRHRPS